MFSSVAAVEPSLPRRGILQSTVTSALLSQVLQNVLLLFFNIIFSLQIDIGDLSKQSTVTSALQSQVLQNAQFTSSKK